MVINTQDTNFSILGMEINTQDTNNFIGLMSPELINLSPG